MAENELRGKWQRISPARRFMNDLIHYANQVPSIPVARTMNLSSLVEARAAARPRPSWTAILLKGFGLVAHQHPVLRRSYIPWPWPHFYEHPINVAAVAIEKEYRGERMVLGTKVFGPENKSLVELTEILRRYKETPVTEIGYYRMALRISKLPKPLRRALWWTTLKLSGYKKAKRLGTCGLTSYGALGAEQIHPIGPFTTTLTFGPISPSGEVVVKVIYDHRVLDGAEVARHLLEIEQRLHGVILRELESLAHVRMDNAAGVNTHWGNTARSGADRGHRAVP